MYISRVEGGPSEQHTVVALTGSDFTRLLEPGGERLERAGAGDTEELDPLAEHPDSQSKEC